MPAITAIFRLQLLQFPLLDELRWIAGDDGPWFDIFCHDRSGTDDRPLANRDAGEDIRSCSNPNIILDRNRFSDKIERWRMHIVRTRE